MTSSAAPPPNRNADAQHIADLEAEVLRLESAIALSRDLVHRAEVARQTVSAELERVRASRERLRSRKAVRLALALADYGAPVFRLVSHALQLPRRFVRGPRPPSGLRRAASAADERRLIAAIRAISPPRVTSDPLVSIVILNRDGRAHLERCLGAVAKTAYRNIEIIVVDNGSNDGSADFVERLAMPFPVTVIRNRENRSFSEANGQGVAMARGDLICLINNDVDPITEHWLGFLVETMNATGAAAVGARLIYPRSRSGPRAGRRFADLTVQHAGVEFGRGGPIPLPRVMGAGEDPRAEMATEIADRPALTAACLLLRRDVFEAVGGFSPDYDYGLEDVDLCLKLRTAGHRLIYDGRAALWHHESATRVADPQQYAARVVANRETFVRIWGPRLYGEVLLDALDSGGRLSSSPYHVAIAMASGDPAGGSTSRDTAHGLGEALEKLGWRASYLESTDEGWYRPDPGVEAVIVLSDQCDIRRLPRQLITMAWIRDEPERWLGQPWFDEYDVVFAATDPIVQLVRDRSAKVASLLEEHSGDARARMMREALVTWASALRIGIRTGVPSWEVASAWGDYHFARGLQRAFERSGHPSRVHLLPDWNEPPGARDDGTVHLFGRMEAPTNPGQVNVLWQISHPDLAKPSMYDCYDHVFVASDRFAAKIEPLVSVPVSPLHQATDPDRFRPDPSGPHHQLLFVANSRRVRRRIVDDLADTSHDLAVYGTGWTPELVRPRFVKGEHIPNTELARYYSSADVVLNDHWDDMRSEGFISNRIYDALAAGAFVISDHVDGIAEEFEGTVVTYDRQDELEGLINGYLADPAERGRLAERGRQIVLERHTFDHRAATIVEVIAGSLARRRMRFTALETASPAGSNGEAGTGRTSGPAMSEAPAPALFQTRSPGSSERAPAR